MIKKAILTILVLLSVNSYSQDTSKIKELSSVQVIGVKTDDREPITQIKYNCDSLSFLNQQKDPFFVLDKISPSIYSQSDNGQCNGYSYLRMRGLDQTRINFNLNGIPLNEMEDQGIYFSNMPGFYNYISNISVQRGVGNSKFGQTSIAGSVNMESKDMTKRIKEVNLLINSNLPENRYYNIFYSPGINKNGFTYQLGGTWQQNQGFKYHSGNNGGSIFYGLGLYRKHNIFKIYGFTGFSHNQLAFYGVPKSDTIDYKANFNQPSDKDTFNQSLVSFNWVNFSKKYLKINTSAYFGNVNGTYNTGGILFGVNSYQYGIMSNFVYEKKNDFINLAINANTYKREHFGQDYNGVYFDTIFFLIEEDIKDAYQVTTNQIVSFLENKSYSSVSQQNQYIGCLKLFAKYILGKKDIHLSKIERPKSEKKLPQVIDHNHIINQLSKIENIKHQSILTLTYSVGLRVSEITNIKIEDIDSKRMLIHIKNAKGRKDRIVSLSKKVLELLREYWKIYRPTEYLFNGQNSIQYSIQSCQKLYKNYIDKDSSIHTLRHSSFTNLLENGTDLRIIQKIAGHSSVKTTEIYTHVSNRLLNKVNLPI